MTELSPESIEALKTRVAALGARECDNAVLREAQRIAEPEHKGSSQNVYAVLPQLAGDVLKGREAKININGNDTVDVFELTSALVAAAQIAKQQGIKLENVSVDAIAELTPEICRKLQGALSPECGKPGNSKVTRPR